MKIIVVLSCTVVVARLAEAYLVNRRMALRNAIGYCSLLAPQIANAKNLPDPVDSSRSGSPEALQGILDLRESLKNIYYQVQKGGSSVATISVPTREKDFKAIFDAYSDPVSYKQRFVDQNAFLVYYTRGFDGPGRPSIESDLPVKQTLQFGLRNDAWVSFEDALAEIRYQMTNPGDKEDMLNPLARTIAAIDTYLDISGVKR